MMRKPPDFRKGLRSNHGADRVGIRRIEHLPRFIGRQEAVDLFLRRNVHALERMGKHKTVHADHNGQRHFFCNAEGPECDKSQAS